jgi:zinc protease
MQTTRVTIEELKTAKQYLTGSLPLHLDTQVEHAAFLAQAEYHGLGLDYLDEYPALIGSVTKQDVLRVPGDHLDAARRILVIVEDLEASDGGHSGR